MGKVSILLALFAASGFAASDDAAIQSTFVKPWIDALRSKDTARIEKFFHPATRACMNASTKDFFDFVVDREEESVPAGGYHVSRIEPLKGAPPALLPADGFPYPVHPAYDLDVQFDQSDLILGRFLAKSNGSWFEVYPCPNAKGMAYFRKQLAEGEAQQHQAAQIAAGLKDPLRSELKGLLRQQRKVDAIQKVRQATGVDLAMAMRVVDLLEPK